MSYRRGWIAAFLFLLAMINYIDRTTLSFAIQPIAKEFQLSDVAKGYLFSSFLWTYAICLIPIGMLVDRFGSKRVAAWGIGVWSAATALTGLAGNSLALLCARLIMGAARPRAIPLAERSSASGSRRASAESSPRHSTAVPTPDQPYVRSWRARSSKYGAGGCCSSSREGSDSHG